ncbi:MAG: hypothetical protein ACI9ON_002029 [Limisphaerales bacterium]
MISSKLLAALAVPMLLGLIASPMAKVPDDLDEIQRQTRIIEEVLQGALRQELRSELRVTNVDAQYLAPQGVLISVNINTPWLKFDKRGEPEFQFHGNISIPEIPAMVTSILQDLQIRVPAYEPEALEEIRELREEQRDLRMEGREHRSALRGKRRELVRTDDSGDQRELEEEIVKIEKQLQLIDQQYDSLTAEIESQYAYLREQPQVPTAVAKPANPTQPLDLDEVFTQAICDYGSTLKSLDSDQYITLAIRQGNETQYLAYRMDHVENCGLGNMKPDRLLEHAYQYDG